MLVINCHSGAAC